MTRLIVALMFAGLLALGTVGTVLAGSVEPPRGGFAPLPACISIEPNNVNPHADISGVVSSSPCP